MGGGSRGRLSLQEVLDSHTDLFKDELGLIKGVTDQIPDSC